MIQGNLPAHLAARWCSREENYENFKLVMTPLIKAFPNCLEIENKNGETPQFFLDKGAKRVNEQRQEQKLKNERLSKLEDENDRLAELRDLKRYASPYQSPLFNIIVERKKKNSEINYLTKKNLKDLKLMETRRDIRQRMIQRNQKMKISTTGLTESLQNTNINEKCMLISGDSEYFFK